MFLPLPVDYRGLEADIPDDCLAVPALGYDTHTDFMFALTMAYYWAFPSKKPFDSDATVQNLQAQMLENIATVRPQHYHIFKVKGSP